MAIELKAFRIRKCRLRNEPGENSITLEIRYDYECNAQDETLKEIRSVLSLQAYAKDNREDIESSPLYVSAEIEADFSSSTSISTREANDETFRLLFPFIQAYIVQLTAGSYMPPLRLPYMTFSDIRSHNETEVEPVKQTSKAGKHTKTK